MRLINIIITVNNRYNWQEGGVDDDEEEKKYIKLYRNKGKM